MTLALVVLGPLPIVSETTTKSIRLGATGGLLAPPPPTWRDSIFLVRYDVPLMKSTGKKINCSKIGFLAIYVKIIFILPKKPKKCKTARIMIETTFPIGFPGVHVRTKEND